MSMILLLLKYVFVLLVCLLVFPFVLLALVLFILFSVDIGARIVYYFLDKRKETKKEQEERRG